MSSTLDAAPAPPAEQVVRPERAVIEAHLREHAARYCSALFEEANVVLVRASHRAAARLYWYRVGCGSAARTVIVKVPGDPADAAVGGASGRPRLAPPPPLAIKYAREHQALDLLQRHLSALDDPRFGFVPVLDRIDAARAIVMGEVDGRPMTALLPRLSRISLGGAGDLRHAVENAGAWLREYHGLDLPGARARQPTRENFVAHARGCCEYLAAELGRAAFFAGLAERLADAAARLLPPELPLGLAHGDFAPRNVLVGRDGRVTVIDTTAAWRAPVYEDLAKLALALRVSRAQVWSHGLAFGERRLRRVNRWLFAGYFGGEPVPEAQIRLYGLLLLLDKWCFELALPPRGSRLADAARRRLLDAWFTREARLMAGAL